MKRRKIDVPKGKGKGRRKEPATNMKSPKGSATNSKLTKDNKEIRLSETGEVNVDLMEDQTCNECHKEWNDNKIGLFRPN